MSRLIKMQGCGNDFIFIDQMKAKKPLSLGASSVRSLCDRHFGVGADGIAILSPGTHTDAQWNFFNTDGSRAEMCGNAARCAILYLADHYFTSQRSISLATEAGVIHGKKVDDRLVEVTMPMPKTESFSYDEKLVRLDSEVLRLFCVNTGVPHAVIETEDFKNFPKEKIGQALVKHPIFGEAGSNITFFQKKETHRILSSTFERGVECETLACGTGVTAAALIYSQLYLSTFPILVEVPGGTLEVDKRGSEYFLKGAASYVMEITLLMDLELTK